eukprot:GFKZ01001837.1.p2 GENE.GFKZ01001837.1~~GFKZ01001837.1.p2  ORF type:complete len:133 (+),score=9.41 GFKZ01001837.1:33-431(+)
MSTTPSPPTSPSSPVSPSIQSSHDPLSNPEDSTCELRFLMVNGESFRLVLPATASVYQVKQRVIETRPKGTLPLLTFLPFLVVVHLSLYTPIMINRHTQTQVYTSPHCSHVHTFMRFAGFREGSRHTPTAQA